MILRICYPQNFVSKTFVLRGFNCTQTWSRLKQDPHHPCSKNKINKNWEEKKKKENKKKQKEEEEEKKGGGGGGEAGYAKKMFNIVALLLQQWLCWQVLTQQAGQQTSTGSG